MPPDPELAALGTPERGFAGFASPYVYDAPGGKKIEQTVWGDYIGLTGKEDGDWREVKARGALGWMHSKNIQEDRLLEINFVDVGQGDGCFIVTPGDQKLLVDAGKYSEMFHFLSWRFGLTDNPERVVEFRAGIITHPDQDHYEGFSPLLKSGQFRFDTLFHNGIVERAGGPGLGPSGEIDGIEYLTDVITNRDALRTIIDDSVQVGGRHYPKLLKMAVDEDYAGDVCMLSSRDEVLDLGEDDLTIEMLGPVPEGDDDKPRLRILGDEGITKNGHSVTFRLRYRDVSVLLGGDLNKESQSYLFEHYTQIHPDGVASEEQRQAMIDKAWESFGSHAAKGCHHGSAEFVDEFLGAIGATITVISSGDNESYAHPRPDALGALGKWGRGVRPYIFSTELARSPSENTNKPRELMGKVEGLSWELAETEDELAQSQIFEEIKAQKKNLERAVAVYGLINLRTDGHRLVMAQKLERSSGSKKWDVHCFEVKDEKLVAISCPA